MKQPVRVLVSQTTDPFFNIATEEWLFRTGDISVPTLYLWRNEPTVVIGRCQNPWKECNIQKMKAEGVHLTRRYSGGGAVYQDLGNTNFTFLTSMDNHDKERNSGIIIRALSKFGVSAETSGRNDIITGGLKVSGAAYKLSPPRALHHGTLLINVDLGALAGLLHPNKLKLMSKGIHSVSSRVTNLQVLNKDITHHSLSEAIVTAFCEHYSAGTVKPDILDHEALSKIESLAKVFNEIKDDDWRYGQSPAFTHHLEGRFESPSPWGTIDVHLDCTRNLVTTSKVFSDSLYPALMDALQKGLEGVSYDEKGVDEAMKKTVELASGSGLEIEDLAGHAQDLGKWLKASL